MQSSRGFAARAFTARGASYRSSRDSARNRKHKGLCYDLKSQGRNSCVKAK